MWLSRISRAVGFIFIAWSCLASITLGAKPTTFVRSYATDGRNGFRQFGRRLTSSAPPHPREFGIEGSSEAGDENDPRLNAVGTICEAEVCDIVSEEECGVCHSMYMRECDIRMEANFYPVKVRECVKSPDCLSGVRRSCSTVYKSECSTKMEYRNMTEDHPVCNVERVETCKDDGKCSKVPVMRCNIQQRTVRKMQPSSECRRVPYTVCRKSKCEVEKCFTRLTMRKEMEPKEECAYKEKRICPQSTVSTDCRTRTKLVCKKNKDCPQDNKLQELPAP